MGMNVPEIGEHSEPDLARRVEQYNGRPKHIGAA